MRLFWAFELPPPVHEDALRLQSALRAKAAPGSVRWVTPQQLHVTVKFLGEVDAAEAAIAAAGARTPGVAPFTLRLGAAGTFGGRRPRVVWLGLEGEVQAAAALAQALDECLEPLGFRPEQRAFVPHLTLGRVKDTRRRGRSAAPAPGGAARGPDPVLALAEALRACPAPRGQSFRVSEVVLFQSELRSRQPARYTALCRLPLGGGDRTERA
jgi:RNA 2',3'-cyclic 3'-phosphodiesterase